MSKHWAPKRNTNVVGFRRPDLARTRRRRRRGLGIGRDDLIGMAMIGLVAGGAGTWVWTGDQAMPFGVGAAAASPAHVRVIDGDTFDYRGMRVRIADIDTPEVRGQCPYEIRLAARATQRMRALLNQGPFELHPLRSGTRRGSLRAQAQDRDAGRAEPGGPAGGGGAGADLVGEKGGLVLIGAVAPSSV